MSEHKSRRQRTRAPQENSPDREAQTSSGTNDIVNPFDYENNPWDVPAFYEEEYGKSAPSAPPAPKPPKAKKKPKEDKKRIALTRENIMLLSLLGFALLVAIVFTTLFVLDGQNKQTTTNTQNTTVPYDITQPFGTADITAAQMEQIDKYGSYAFLDHETGPHGLKIGDSLDTLLQRFPVSYTQTSANDYAWDETGDNMTELVYEYLETDSQVIYAARVFYKNGEMIVIPPSAVLSVSSDMIIITLTAPLQPYPVGMEENFPAYAHVYCKFTIDPDTNKITKIVLSKA